MTNKDYTIDIKLPTKLINLPNIKSRYIVLYGGRGGAKSWGIATLLILRALSDKTLTLCAREVQNTIKDSVHKLLADTIDRMQLDKLFDIKKDSITCVNGSRFIFKGLRHNSSEIKSTEGINICWIEEAHNISQESLDFLIPTVRENDSQIIFTFNPQEAEAPVYNNYVLNTRDDSTVIKINYPDNPFFPEVLRKEMEYDKKNDYHKYLHIWEGEPKKITESCIFKDKFIVDQFETPDTAEFFYGADWGFSQDPSCLVRCFVLDDRLYIDYEALGVGVEMDELGQLFNSVPGSKVNKIIADNARPETISYMNSKGYIVKSSKKGKGSIVEGIEFIRSFEKVVIHERCKHTAYEFKSYSYKKDRLTNEILPIIIDKDNHIIDALRYALEDLRKFGRKQEKSYSINQVLGW